MLIKAADDKSKRLKLLEELQSSPALDARQREWLKDAYWRVKKGIEGERDAAFHIESLLRDSENHAVIHDLRIKVGDDEAQIDHLVINRAADFILIETKCFNGNVTINDAGEFTVTYRSGHRQGIESPVSQSQRHERVLRKLLEGLDISGRFGTEPKFHHVVMFHPKAIIQRPDAKRYDTRNVIKADQFAEWRQRYIDAAFSGLGALSVAVNFRSAATVKEWGEKLARQHRPDDQLALPEFMRPKASPSAPDALVTQQAAAPSVAARVPEEPAPQAALAPTAARVDAAAKRLFCATCGVKITYPEGKFCWKNAKRFGGLQYCREHQTEFA
ncbi:MAG: NERD domain-containing protein [Inhella sp.]